MGKQVDQLEVAQSAHVDLAVQAEEIGQATIEATTSMERAVPVECGAHGVKSEAVDAVRLRKPAHLRKQEAQHLESPEVEEARTPHGMPAVWPVQKVLAIGSVKGVETLARVGGRVRVYELDEDLQPVAMSRIDELLQLCWRPES